MLKKLVELDIKIYAKMLLKPLLICLLVFVTSVSIVANSFSGLAYAAGVLSLIVLAGFVIYAQIAHFYRHFYSDHGYLTHTLPATPAQRLWAKWLSGFLLHILATGIVLLGIQMLMSAAFVLTREIGALPRMWDLALEYIGPAGILAFIGALLLIFPSFFANYSLCISLGMSKSLQRLRAGGIAVVFVAIYALSQLINYIGARVPLSLRIFLNPHWYRMIQIVKEVPMETVRRVSPGTAVTLPAVTHIDLSVVSIVFSIVFVVVSFLLVLRELKRVNLR